MPHQIKVNDSIIEISTEDLKIQIEEGLLGPGVMIKSKIFTDYEWWTLDNLRIFHRHTPIEYPPGDHLLDFNDLSSRRELQALALAQKTNAYSTGNLIEQSFYLLPLERISKEELVRGSARLFYLPSFYPEVTFTAIFRRNNLYIELCKGSSSLWSSIPQRTGGKTKSGLWKETVSKNFDASAQIRQTCKIGYSDLPNPIHSWEEFLLTSLRAIDCKNPALDGVGYRHKVYDSSHSIDVSWSNPHIELNIEQFVLIEWYQVCLRIAGLNEYSLLDV